MNPIVRAFIGPLVFAFLMLAWWFDHRGFLHGMALMAQIWWLWSTCPWRSANNKVSGPEPAVKGTP